MSNSKDEFLALEIPAAGHWQRVAVALPRSAFGVGCKHDFSWYFQGQSNVRPKNVNDLCKWLSKCKYSTDSALFQEEEFWQHPVTFETTKKGDCDDHALWAWRKLTEMGLRAEYVCGKMRIKQNHKYIESGHAWVIFKKKDKRNWYVLECTEKDKKKMLIDFDDAEKTYLPEVSIDGELKTYRFVRAMRITKVADKR